jgi:hypothetical protein
MKLTHITATIALSLFTAAAVSAAPQVYLNKNLGFNVPGYNYKQSEFPCDIDSTLVESLVKRSKAAGIQMEAVSTADKIQNGVIPVLAIDIEQLVLNEKFRFGSTSTSNLPRVQVTAALIAKNLENGFVTAKHSCAIATLNEFTPSSEILDMGTTATVCSATRKCLDDLSKDIVQWTASQVK